MKKMDLIRYKESDESSSQNYVIGKDGGVFPDEEPSSSDLTESSGGGGIFRRYFRWIFLPEGFPDSVSSDYVEYQFWDTLQAFASSISGSLATQSVLKSVGVGDESASALSATLTWLIRHGFGMIGQIAFSYKLGRNLDFDCKKWRLFADLFNDLAVCLELTGPYLGSSWTLPILCASGLARSLVGVAGGATRAAVTQHQAVDNNISDVAAKDGSQETLVNLSALILNLVLLPQIAESPSVIWILFLALTAFHLFANFKAVTSLNFKTFNRNRLWIVVNEYAQNNRILSPEKANKLEPVIRNAERINIHLGISIRSLNNTSIDAVKLSSDKFLVFPGTNKKLVRVLLMENADLMEAYFEALNETFYESKMNFKIFKEAVVEAGWNLDYYQISTLGYFGSIKNKTE